MLSAGRVPGIWGLRTPASGAEGPGPSLRSRLSPGRLALLSLAALLAGLAGLYGALEPANAAAGPNWVPSALAVLVLGAAYLALRSREKAASVPSFRIVRTLASGPNQQLMAVRFGRRLLLLGQGPSHLTRLGELTDPEEIRDFEQPREASNAP